MSAHRDRNGNHLWSRLKRGLFGSGRQPRDEHEAWNKRLVQSLSHARFPSWRQIRHLPEVISSSDGLKLQIGVILVALGLTVFGIRWYFTHTQIVPAIGGSLTEGVVGTPRSLNPVLSLSNDVDADIVRLTYSSMFADDGGGGLVSDLAQGYDVSADRKTYIFHLRDAKWSDSQPLTTDDVLFTFALIQDPAWKSPLMPEFRDITAEKVDDQTVRFKLKEPLAPFLSELTFGILPSHIWKDVAPQDVLQAEANLKPVGSGPFMFDNLKRDPRGFVMSYTLKRNPDYSPQAPYLDRITFQFYPDYASALDGLRRHDIDSLSYVPRDMRASLASAAHTVMMSLDLPQYEAVFFNQQHNDALKDSGVRRALDLAVNKSSILLDVLHGDGRIIDAPPLPGDDATTTPAADPAQAGRLLDQAGWPVDPADGIRKKTTTTTTKTSKGSTKTSSSVPLHVTLTIVDQPEARQIADIIKQSWMAIGVAVDVNALPAAEIYSGAIKPRAYEALLYSQLLGNDPDPYPFWYSNQAQDPGQNLAVFSNRKADDAIDAARVAPDRAAREAQYRVFLSVLADQTPAVFLYSPTYAYPLPSDLRGFASTRIAEPSDRFADVTNWYLKTARSWK